MTTLDPETRRYFRLWLTLFILVSLAMGGLQWLVFARGGGAQNPVYRLSASGHPRSSSILEAINESVVLRALDRAWQSLINAPRNHLFSAIGIINTPDAIHFYGTSERPGWWPDVRDFLVFSAGTVVVYIPILFMGAWMQARIRLGRSQTRRAGR
jgi:hypothetical protein